jgi:outer membrane lipoprotein-sorting protein
MLLCAALFSVLFLSACGGSSTSETPPTAEELIQQAADASSSTSAQSTTLTGSLDYSATSEGSTQSLNVPFSVVAAIQEDPDMQKAELKAADKYSLIVDGQDAYFSNGEKTVKFNTSEQMQQSGLGYDPAQITELQKKLTGEMGQEISKGATVETGPSVDGKETWALKVNFEDIDYRAILTSYGEAYKEILQSQISDLPADQAAAVKQVGDQLSQEIENIPEADLDKARKLLSLTDMQMLFYQEDKLPAGMNFSVDVNTEDIVSTGMIAADSEEAKKEAELKANMDVTITYSDSEPEITIPTDAIDANSPEGQREMMSLFGGLFGA